MYTVYMSSDAHSVTFNTVGNQNCNLELLLQSRSIYVGLRVLGDLIVPTELAFI